MSSQYTKTPFPPPTLTLLPANLGVGWTVNRREYFRRGPNSPGYPVVGLLVSYQILEPTPSKNIQEIASGFHVTSAAKAVVF